jgi:hypothetical protein
MNARLWDFDVDGTTLKANHFAWLGSSISRVNGAPLGVALGCAIYKRFRKLGSLVPVRDTRVLHVRLESRAQLWKLLGIAVAQRYSRLRHPSRVEVPYPHHLEGSRCTNSGKLQIGYGMNL